MWREIGSVCRDGPAGRGAPAGILRGGRAGRCADGRGDIPTLSEASDGAK